jgi:replication fork protection complex subunit Tof1/Swi1
VVEADNSALKIAMFKNGHLRLLMTLIGFQRIGEEHDPEGSWIIPSSLSAEQLKQALDLVKNFEFSPPVFDDGQEAGDLIRRKSANSTSRRRAAFDDEDDGIDNDTEEELLFEPGGPTAMKKSDALEALKKNRRRRRKEGSVDPETKRLTDEEVKARAEARRQKELEKNRKIKSELYVHDSDEEDDTERDRLFFEQEEKLREKSKIAIMKQLLGVGKEKIGGPTTPSRNKKRQSSAISIDSDDEAGGNSSAAKDNVLEESEEGESATDTPMSSPHNRSSQTKRRKVSIEEPEFAGRSETEELIKDGPAIGAEDSEDEDVAVIRPARQRVRAGFIVDSSDEE